MPFNISKNFNYTKWTRGHCILYKIMRQHDLGYSDIAREIGTERQTVAQWFSRSSIPRNEYIIRIQIFTHNKVLPIHWSTGRLPDEY